MNRCLFALQTKFKGHSELENSIMFRIKYIPISIIDISRFPHCHYIYIPCPSVGVAASSTVLRRRGTFPRCFGSAIMWFASPVAYANFSYALSWLFYQLRTQSRLCDNDPVVSSTTSGAAHNRSIMMAVAMPESSASSIVGGCAYLLNFWGRIFH